MSISGCNKVCLQFTKQSHSSSSGLRNTDVTEIVQISSNGMDVSHNLETKFKLIDITGTSYLIVGSLRTRS